MSIIRHEPSQGIYSFVDPISGENLTDSVPEALYEYPEFAQGIAFLKEHGSEVSVDLHLTRHSNANDMGQNGEFEEIVRDGKYDAIFLEQTFFKAEDQDILNQYAAGKISLSSLLDRTINTHALRTIMAIGSGKIPVYFADVPHPDESEAGVAFRAMRKEAAVSKKSNMSELNDEELRQEATFAAYQNLREWYAIGRLGCSIEENYHNLPIRALLVYGSAHENLTKKLASLGVNADKVGQVDTKHHPASRRIIGTIASREYRFSSQH